MIADFDYSFLTLEIAVQDLSHSRLPEVCFTSGRFFFAVHGVHPLTRCPGPLPLHFSCVPLVQGRTNPILLSTAATAVLHGLLPNPITAQTRIVATTMLTLDRTISTAMSAVLRPWLAKKSRLLLSSGTRPRALCKERGGLFVTAPLLWRRLLALSFQFCTAVVAISCGRPVPLLSAGTQTMLRLTALYIPICHLCHFFTTSPPAWQRIVDSSALVRP